MACFGYRLESSRYSSVRYLAPCWRPITVWRSANSALCGAPPSPDSALLPAVAMQVHETCRGGGCSRRWLLLPLFLLVAWYLTPFALQGAASDTQSCSKRDPALCDDHGEVRQGRDHVVCVYADRVVKTVWAYVETRLA